MSVSASFIEGLLSTSEGDSNAGGSGDSDHHEDAGAGDPEAVEPLADSSGKPHAGERSQRTASGSNGDAESGAPKDLQDKSGAGTGKSTPDQVAEPPKPANDDPVTQIGRLNGALREVRGENKELKTLLSKQAEQFAEMSRKIEALSAPKPAVVEPEPEPDFLAEPKVYVDKTIAKTAEAVRKLEEAEAKRAKDAEAQTEQAKTQEQMQQQWGEVLAQEAEFTAATPDYNDALQFVRQIRVTAYAAEFEALNDRAPTQAEVSKALTSQEIQGALLLQSKGKNPAQWYYNYAKTMGYKQVAAVVDPPATTTTAPPATVKTPAPKPDKEAVKSMGSGGSGSNGADPEDANRDPMAALLAGVHGEMTAKRKARKG